MQREQAIMTQVKGFLVPIFMEDRADGDRLNGLAPSDFAKVRAGYACARCLAEFETYMAVCPLCFLARDVERDIEEAPQLWLDHLAEESSDVPVEKPTVVNPFAGGEPLPEMETIPVRKLRKSRWGRG